MVKDINNWLANGCSYQVGLSLLEKYSSNAFLLSILKKCESDFNRQKLAGELQALLDAIPAVPAPVLPVAPIPVIPEIPKQIPEIPIIPLDHPINYKPEPTILEVIRERENTHAELRMLKALTPSTPEGLQLKDLAERLVRLAKRNAVAWERYNYLTENPEHEPDEPAAQPVMVDLRLIERREQIRKSLNKAENRIKGEAKPKQKTLDLIAERRQQLADIDAKIADLKVGAKP